MLGPKLIVIAPLFLLAEAQYGRFGGARPSSEFGYASAPMDTLYGFECRQPNGFYPMPTSCDSYVECKNNVAIANRCPDGLSYTPNARWPNFPCNYRWLEPQNSRCGRPQMPAPSCNTTTTTTTSTTTTTTPAPTTTTTTTTLAPTTLPPTTTPTTTTIAPRTPAPGCSCRQQNSYCPVSTRCDAYCECKNNVPMQFECPRGLVYNPSAQWPNFPCGYPSQGRCGSGGGIRNPNPIAQYPSHGFYPSNSGRDYGQNNQWQNRGPAGFSCRPPSIGRNVNRSYDVYKYRYGNSCGRYVACQNAQPHLFSCDSGLAFDERSEACVDSRLVSNCVP